MSGRAGRAPLPSVGTAPPRRGLKRDNSLDQGDLSPKKGKAPRSRDHPRSASKARVEDGLTDEEMEEELGAIIGCLAASTLDSVVKVFATHTEPNYSLPWQMRHQNSSTSTGFVISNRRILTNAHSVEHHTVVKLKKRGVDTKFVAEVLAIGPECDLALLTVHDNAFWKGLKPISFGSLPYLQESVTVVGYPIGGENMSVTQGVVSRLDMQQYAHGSTELLAVQIDAAINAGNSGGPAFNGGGQCIGVAFQSLKADEAEAIGYIIPAQVVHHFLDDYARHRKYTGFCDAGFYHQPMENETLRRAYKMAKEQTGILIKKIPPIAPAAAVLQKWDVVLSLDGTRIASDGSIVFRNGERIGFHYLVSQHFVGDKVALEVLRGGVVLKLEIALNNPKYLVPLHQHDAAEAEQNATKKKEKKKIEDEPATSSKPSPSYFITGGLVFVPLCEPYMRSEYGEEFDFKAPVKLLEKWLHGLPQERGEQVVVLSQVLAADVNIGYEGHNNIQLLRFNGETVRNLKHLVGLVEQTKDRFLKFELEYDEVVMLDTAKTKLATPAILSTHRIPHAKSIDLQ